MLSVFSDRSYSIKNLSFNLALALAWKKTNSLLCVGLDPEPALFPAQFSKNITGIFKFCCCIIDATAEFASAFKLQIAHFSACRAEIALEALIDYIHTTYPGKMVILDAKRGDIGNTAKQYAREAFERYCADATTVNPYYGFNTIAPYLEYEKKGVIVLCCTSNPSSYELQFLNIEGRMLYEIVAEKVANEWNKTGALSLVVGATYPHKIASVRKYVGNMPLLIPGIGVQGGNINKVVKFAKTTDGTGMIINVSRAILYADCSTNFAKTAAFKARSIRDTINNARFLN